jgi:hypothetical protein
MPALDAVESRLNLGRNLRNYRPRRIELDNLQSVASVSNPAEVDRGSCGSDIWRLRLQLRRGGLIRKLLTRRKRWLPIG